MSWQLYRHKCNPVVFFWVHGTGEIAKQRNGRYSVEGEVVDIRNPFGLGSSEIRPPELCAPAGQILKRSLGELYERTEAS